MTDTVLWMERSPGLSRVAWALQYPVGPSRGAVSSMGQLGVVSGTAIDNVFVRRLQDHGIDGELQTALDCFPAQGCRCRHRQQIRRRATRRVRRRIADPPGIDARRQGRSIDAIVFGFLHRSKARPRWGTTASSGINLLTKVQLPTAPRCVVRISPRRRLRLDGAGVPTHIPGPRSGSRWANRLVDPSLRRDGWRAMMIRPSHSTCDPPHVPSGRRHFVDRTSWASSRRTCSRSALAKRSNGPVDGFVVERTRAPAGQRAASRRLRC